MDLAWGDYLRENLRVWFTEHIAPRAPRGLPFLGEHQEHPPGVNLSRQNPAVLHWYWIGIILGVSGVLHFGNIHDIFQLCNNLHGVWGVLHPHHTPNV